MQTSLLKSLGPKCYILNVLATSPAILIKKRKCSLAVLKEAVKCAHFRRSRGVTWGGRGVGVKSLGEKGK